MTPPPSPPEDAPGAKPTAGSARAPVALKGGEAARHAYVTGSALTIAEAAAVAGITESHAMALSSRDGWVEARKEFLERQRAALASETAEGEARIQAVSRRLAWRVAWKALSKLDAQLDDPASRTNAFQVDALVRAAMSLSSMGDQQADEAIQRLRRRSTPEVMREFVLVMRQFGMDPDDLDDEKSAGAKGDARGVVTVDPSAPVPAPNDATDGTPPP